VKKLLRAILRRFGYRLANIEFEAKCLGGLDGFFYRLKYFGFAPVAIVDVGANHGDWTRTALKYFPNAQYTLIEPQDNLKTHVADLLSDKITWVSAGAADRPGMLELAISDRDDSSSFALTGDYQKVPVNVVTLNDLCHSAPDMVKIDAEGFDLKVLSGASRLFGKTEIFLVEFGICTGHENTLSRVLLAMEHAGYSPFDITDLNRSPKTGRLWLGEMAFIRNDSKLLDGIREY
jgi:FkbM family methyltransferase